jgi:hypothetical protein
MYTQLNENQNTNSVKFTIYSKQIDIKFLSRAHVSSGADIFLEFVEDYESTKDNL